MNLISAILSPVTSIANKLVMDKDKYAELQFKKEELRSKKDLKLLAITTTPRIDALVKLLYAIDTVVLKLFRPVGSACMTAFGIYCHLNDIDLDPIIHGGFDGAFLAWGASRHVNKQAETKAGAKNNPVVDDFYE